MTHYMMFTRLFFLTGLILLTGLSPVWGQFARVEFDYANAYFNNGQSLPAEQPMIITGAVASNIYLVEMDIFRPKANQEKLPLFAGVWKRKGETGESTFRVPVNYRLTGSSSYDFRVVYYRAISSSEKNALRQDLFDALDSYLAQSIERRDDDIRLRDNPGNMIQDLNRVVIDGLAYYRSLNQISFDGFSDLVAQALDNLDKRPLAEAEAGIAQVETLLHTEVDQLLNSDLVLRTDIRQVPQYETQRTRRPLAVNVGYGGVLLERGSESLSYGTSPYVGISLPLANPALAGPFWSNASISLGVFLENFENADNETVTGPIFGRPYYLGVGYNFFRFVRLNLGVTALEEVGTSSLGGGSAALDVDAISIRPFIGISAELDVWAGFRERR
jgi:hypothetical protein